MSPRYRRGDKVLVHPGRPLTPRATAVVITSTQDVIMGEFIAWRHITELTDGEAQPPANDPSSEYVLELLQYSSGHYSNKRSYENDQETPHQVIIHPSQISCVARVVGTVES